MRLAIAFCGVCLACSASAGDQAREQAYADAIQQQPAIGEAVWLQTGDGGRFLALFVDAEKTANEQVVIILHDADGHPDQQPLIRELRTVLPRHRWASLAIQLPLREAGAALEDYYPLVGEADARIQAAIDHAIKIGAKQIAMVGYGIGAAMAAARLSQNPANVVAFAAISLPVPDSSQAGVQTLSFVKNINLPLLDVYAEADWPDVTETAAKRRVAGKENPVYRQIRIDGDDHAYRQNYPLLVKRVYSWLATTIMENQQ
ncbi:DUF3530 family protein [Methylomonas sp. MED-D]|uniref:DUF3530 family protein n=1 Tax=Methylomonas sp. MED-D TaxID=3418768 RepID=UPI003D00E6C3